MTVAERRKRRLTREALGSPTPTSPVVEEALGKIAIVGLVLFLFHFVSQYPA